MVGDALGVDCFALQIGLNTFVLVSHVCRNESQDFGRRPAIRSARAYVRKASFALIDTWQHTTKENEFCLSLSHRFTEACFCRGFMEKQALLEKSGAPATSFI